MAVLISLAGIFLLVVSKQLIFRSDVGAAVWHRWLELSVDVYFLAFLLIIVSLASLKPTPEYYPLVVIVLMIGIIVSVSIWKYSCSQIDDVGGSVTIENKGRVRTANIISFLVSFALLCIATYAVHHATRPPEIANERG
jgi:Ca2+/Na+ antiporter